MRYREFAELLPEDRVEHFEEFEDEDEARKEYHRLLHSAQTVEDATAVTRAFNQYLEPAPAPQDEPRPHSPEETAQFHRELDAAPDMDAAKQVLAKYGRLANPSEHGYAS